MEEVLTPNLMGLEIALHEFEKKDCDLIEREFVVLIFLSFLLLKFQIDEKVAKRDYKPQVPLSVLIKLLRRLMIPT
ncbi:hypothetical protein P8452_70472 [Trifolium repens]|nr:hypothetical protein P8452_70472 [Trifolium repens]